MRNHGWDLCGVWTHDREVVKQIPFGFQWNIVERFNTKWRCAYLFLVQVSPFSSESYGPWIVMHYVYRVSFISLLCSQEQQTRFQCNFVGTFNTERRWTYHLLIQVRPFSSELCSMISCMYYVLRVGFASMLFLNSCWLDFSETLWERSIQRGNVHIICMSGPNHSVES